MFDVMFSTDRDFRKLIVFAEVPITDLKEDYRAKASVVIAELRHFVIKQHELLEEEFKLFNRCVSEAKKDIDKECINRINEFNHEKKVV